MAYSKQTWVDGDASKPISAARLSHIEDGIESAASTAETAQTSVTSITGRNLGPYSGLVEGSPIKENDMASIGSTLYRRRTTGVIEASFDEDEWEELLGGTGSAKWIPLLEPGSGGRITGLAISPIAPSRWLVSGDMLGIGYSDDAGDTWKPSTGLSGYEMGLFTWHPTRGQEVWCGSMSGPVKSIDGGQTWVLMRSGMGAVIDFPYSAPVDNIIFDSSNPSHMWCFGGSNRRWKTTFPADALNMGAVWESTNGGDSWTKISTVVNNVNIMSATRLGNGSFVVSLAGSQGVYTSANAIAWTQHNSGLPNAASFNVLGDNSNPAHCYLTLRSLSTTPGGVYRSTDSGVNWSTYGTGLPASAGADANNTTRFEALCQNSDGDLFTADLDWSGGQQYRLLSGETAWQVLPDPSIAYPADVSSYVIACDPNDSNILVGGTSDTIVKSINKGTTWTDASSKTVGTGKGGRGFSGLVSSTIALSPYRRRHVIIAAWDAGNLIRTTDAQSWTWPNRGYDPYTGGQHVAYATKDIVYAILGQSGIFNGLGVSVNNGATWTWNSGGTLMARGALDGTPGDYCVRPISADGTKALAVLPNGTVYSTTDTGTNWSVLSSYTAGTARWITTNTDKTAIYICDTSGVKLSTDGGATWNLMAGSPTHLGKLYVDPSDPTVLYGCGSYWRTILGSRGLWRYEGSTWTNLWNDRAIADLAIDPGDPTHLILATCDLPYHDADRASGIKRSTDRGATWTPINTGLPMNRVITVRFDPWDRSHLLCGTYGRGFYEYTLPASTVDIPTVGGSGFGQPVETGGGGDTATVIWDGQGAQPDRPDANHVIWVAPVSKVTYDDRDIVINTEG